MVIRELRLITQNVPEMRDFYAGLMQMEELGITKDRLTLQAGNSVLTFLGGAPSTYHFAFNIPLGTVRAAADWLESKGIPLLPLDGDRIIPFPNWEAEAVYFHDPAGNIVEFIERRRLQIPARASFGAESIVEISEMGVPTLTQSATRQQLEHELGLAPFWYRNEEFAAMGDEHGLFIVVDAALKRWIPTMVEAVPTDFEALVEVAGNEWNVRWQQGRLHLNRQ